MARLLNADFSAQSLGQGPWEPPEEGQETADEWRYSGEGDNLVALVENFTPPQASGGTMLLSGETGFIYQDLAGYADYAGLEVTFTVYTYRAFTAAPLDAWSISIDDGVGETSAACTPGPISVWTLSTVTRTIDTSPTRLRVKINFPSDEISRAGRFSNTGLAVNWTAGANDTVTLSESPSFITIARTTLDSLTLSESSSYIIHKKHPSLSDELTMVDSLNISINPEINVSVTDAVGFQDTLDVNITTKGPNEALLLQDWVRIRKPEPQSNWS